jgi:lipid-A-disaccharide synthase
MLIAGDPSGDMLAGEFVAALRAAAAQQGREMRAFGAGGAHLAAAGAECAFDLTQHAVIGIVEAARAYFALKRLARQLIEVALERRPEIIVCVDFSGFNRRFAGWLRRRIRQRGIAPAEWNPRIVQYVSPQVWASRPARAAKMARDFDLLLTILPFEKEWYAKRLPEFRVEFVGHPIADRHAGQGRAAPAEPPEIVLLPGSRRVELRRHLGLVLDSAERLRAEHPRAVFRLVFANDALREFAATLRPLPECVRAQTGGLAEALRGATLALASTGTVTLECAWYGVPTVAFYRSSWLTAWIARRIVTVKYFSMPNLLADAPVFPEFLQEDATAENVVGAARELLDSPEQRQRVRDQLAGIVASLGAPGAAARAADAVLGLLADR